MDKNNGVITVQGMPMVPAGFNWSVGFQMERFLKALGRKKFLAAKCPECGYVYAPPRNRCAKCYKKMDEKDLIELSGKGTLLSFTTAYVELDGKGNFIDLKQPKIIGAIKLDGADSTIFMTIEEAKPEDLKIGMKVCIAWNQETQGGWKDIKYFKPDKS